MNRTITLTKEVIHAMDAVYDAVYELYVEEDTYALQSDSCCLKAYADGIAEALCIVKEFKS